jgi:ankyrin repeat protein
MENMGTIYETLVTAKLFHINKNDEHGNTLMHIAAQNGNLRIARLLIQKGVNPNHQNKQGQTPGHFAVAYQFYDFASWLFEEKGGGGDDLILNMYGLGPYDGISDEE